MTTTGQRNNISVDNNNLGYYINFDNIKYPDTQADNSLDNPSKDKLSNDSISINCYHFDNKSTLNNSVDSTTSRQKTSNVFYALLLSPFFRPDWGVFAIPNLAHLFLQRDRQKTKKLNFLAHQIGVLRTFFARALNAPKSAPQAYGIFIRNFSNNSIAIINKKGGKILQQQY